MISLHLHERYLACRGKGSWLVVLNSLSNAQNRVNWIKCWEYSFRGVASWPEVILEDTRTHEQIGPHSRIVTQFIASSIESVLDGDSGLHLSLVVDGTTSKNVRLGRVKLHQVEISRVQLLQEVVLLIVHLLRSLLERILHTLIVVHWHLIILLKHFVRAPISLSVMHFVVLLHLGTTRPAAVVILLLVILLHTTTLAAELMTSKATMRLLLEVLLHLASLTTERMSSPATTLVLLLEILLHLAALSTKLVITARSLACLLEGLLHTTVVLETMRLLLLEVLLHSSLATPTALILLLVVLLHSTTLAAKLMTTTILLLEALLHLSTTEVIDSSESTVLLLIILLHLTVILLVSMSKVEILVSISSLDITESVVTLLAVALSFILAIVLLQSRVLASPGVVSASVSSTVVAARVEGVHTSVVATIITSMASVIFISSHDTVAAITSESPEVLLSRLALLHPLGHTIIVLVIASVALVTVALIQILV